MIVTRYSDNLDEPKYFCEYFDGENKQVIRLEEKLLKKVDENKPIPSVPAKPPTRNNSLIIIVDPINPLKFPKIGFH